MEDREAEESISPYFAAEQANGTKGWEFSIKKHTKKSEAYSETELRSH